MVRKCFVLVALMTSVYLHGQEEKTIGATIDDLVFDWDFESTYLEEYTGFKRFCEEVEYREELINLLKEIHHYDSVLYDRLAQEQRFAYDKEIEKTLKDIEEFEAEYDMYSFLKFLSTECVDLKKLDKKKRELEDEIGQESYDGKKYVLINETSKYIHHITKRVDLLQKHVHRLHIE